MDLDVSVENHVIRVPTRIVISGILLHIIANVIKHASW